jgi:hypothetical protein
MATTFRNARQQVSCSVPRTVEDADESSALAKRRSTTASWVGLAALGLAVWAGIYFGPEALRYIKTMRM